jgi:polyhydroxyalkanoate synthesis regulator phasin
VPTELETVLRLVAEGHLTPEEAAPIIDALTQRREPAQGRVERVLRHVESARDFANAARDEAHRVRDAVREARGRQLRIRVTEHGRQVVNLRIPLAFADTALRMVPGIGDDQAARIRQAIDAKSLGPIIDVEDESGDGVLISVE